MALPAMASINPILLPHCSRSATAKAPLNSYQRPQGYVLCRPWSGRGSRIRPRTAKAEEISRAWSCAKNKPRTSKCRFFGVTVILDLVGREKHGEHAPRPLNIASCSAPQCNLLYAFAERGGRGQEFLVRAFFFKSLRVSMPAVMARGLPERVPA